MSTVGGNIRRCFFFPRGQQVNNNNNNNIHTDDNINKNTLVPIKTIITTAIRKPILTVITVTTTKQ